MSRRGFELDEAPSSAGTEELAQAGEALCWKVVSKTKGGERNKKRSWEKRKGEKEEKKGRRKGKEKGREREREN